MICCGLDNLYLYLNGEVQNLIHRNEAKLHERVTNMVNIDEILTQIIEDIDDIVKTLKPHKILFSAVENVVPQSKMNF